MKSKEIENVELGFYAKYIKRVLDIIISGVSLIVLSPVLLITMLLVRIKLGSPIFFTQDRAGLNEKTFKMVKFRTMADYRDANGELLPDEERFTSFGNFLRSTSIDELPELLNVLKGDMSIVGPRPLYTFYLPYYTPKESIRHAVRGGITGLAQINGRALCKMNRRLAYDVEYVENISFLNDLKIVFGTVGKVLKRSDVGLPSVEDEKCLNETREVQRPEYL